jgi:hypothetical protein
MIDLFSAASRPFVVQLASDDRPNTVRFLFHVMYGFTLVKLR